MKLFVSTKKTQGFRDSDFNFVPEDQIVMFGSECDYLEDSEDDEGNLKEEHIDGCCGCHRSMMGILNNKSTTTMKVIDVNITEDKLFELIQETYKRAGLIRDDSNQHHIKNSISSDIEAIIKAIAPLNIGDIVERRGNKFNLRDPNFDPFHIEKSIIKEIESKIKGGLDKKKKVINPSADLIRYRNAQISASEARSLQELEILLNKNFKLVEKLEENRIPSFLSLSNHILEINLYNLLLKSLPSSFKNLKYLKKLNLKYNKLRVLQESFCSLKSLEKLYLEQNSLRYLPDTIGNLKALLVLELQVNNLMELPESIGNLTNLNVLKLSFNKLKSLPKTISNLKKLQILDLGNNQLINLPETLGSLDNLKKLYLNANNLNTVPETIYNLRNLEELYLNSNRISNIPETIVNLSSLKELYLINNKISTIPESIVNIESLREINLTKNPINLKNGSKEQKTINLLRENGVDIVL